MLFLYPFVLAAAWSWTWASLLRRVRRWYHWTALAVPVYAAWLLWTALLIESPRRATEWAGFVGSTALAGLLLALAWRRFRRLSWAARGVVLTTFLLSVLLAFYFAAVFEGNFALAVLWMVGGALVLSALMAYVGHLLLFLGTTPRHTVLVTVCLVTVFLVSLFGGNFHGGSIVPGR